MSTIEADLGRATAALDRIARGMAAKAAGAEAADTAALAALQAENAKLTADLSAAQSGQSAQVAELQAALTAQQAQMAKLDAELQTLQNANAKMRELNTQLRAAVTAGLAPELVDQAVQAEFEALAAQRSAEAAEIDALLAALKPLIEDEPHAAS